MPFAGAKTDPQTAPISAKDNVLRHTGDGWIGVERAANATRRAPRRGEVIGAFLGSDDEAAHGIVDAAINWPRPPIRLDWHAAAVEAG